MTQLDMAFHVRWLIQRDLPGVLQLAQDCFQNGWTEESFLLALRERNTVALVAENDEGIIAFLVYRLHANQQEILHLAVHPRYRRQGVGARIVAKLIGKLSPRKRRQITVLVRESNLPAQLFFRAQGFKAERILRSHYLEWSEDAYLMQYSLTEVASGSTTSRTCLGV